MLLGLSDFIVDMSSGDRASLSWLVCAQSRCTVAICSQSFPAPSRLAYEGPLDWFIVYDATPHRAHRELFNDLTRDDE